MFSDDRRLATRHRPQPSDPASTSRQLTKERARSAAPRPRHVSLTAVKRPTTSPGRERGGGVGGGRSTAEGRAVISARENAKRKKERGFFFRRRGGEGRDLEEKLKQHPFCLPTPKKAMNYYI
ncbi:hypothetical protein NL676_027943 [Syzygium grande]|nr:hypothetical protein NL676_027943 [Syzygium grande]